MVLGLCYELAGADIGYAATRIGGVSSVTLQMCEVGTPLSAYALRGTDVARYGIDVARCPSSITCRATSCTRTTTLQTATLVQSTRYENAWFRPSTLKSPSTAYAVPVTDIVKSVSRIWVLR
eukprot:139631-Rhodomonas_salina.2